MRNYISRVRTKELIKFYDLTKKKKSGESK